MANYDIDKLSSDLATAANWDAGVAFKRTNALPLDKYSIFFQKSDAEDYLSGTYIDPKTGKEAPVSYPGQYLAVIDKDSQAVSAYVVGVDRTLIPLATGGNTQELLAKINQEISDRQTADTGIYGTISGLSGEFVELRDTNLPLSVSNLEKELSVVVEKLSAAEDDYAATYVVKQGGIKVGASINIPKDKVISSAYMVNVKGNKEEGVLTSFTVTWNDISETVTETSNPGAFAAIKQAYNGPEGGDGSYIRITVTNAEAAPIYIAVPQLVDTYIGGETPTISVDVTGKKGETRIITASVKSGSITKAHLSSEVTEYIESTASTAASSAEESAKSAAKTYTNEVSTALSTVIDGKIATEVIDRDYAISCAKEDLIGKMALSVQNLSQVDAQLATDIATVSGDLSQEITDREAADAEVSAYAKQASESALADAKTYTDGLINSVSATVDTKVAAEVQKLEGVDAEISGKVEAEVTNRTTAINALSAELKGDISSEATARDAAIEAKGVILSAYAESKASAAETAAKSYTDSEIEKLSVGTTYETKADAAAKLTEAKGYTDALSTAVDGKIQTTTETLKTYANDTSAYALAESKKYTDGKITSLSTELKGDISQEASDRTTAIKALSVELKGDISTEKTRAEGAEGALDTKIGGLSSELATISADHESRITTVEDKVAKLSSAMHFKGVNLTAELSTGSTTLPIPPYKEGESAQDGDVVIVKDSREFVWAGNQWNELGAEGVWATKTALEAEATRAKASESELSGMVAAEKTRATGVETALSTDLYALSGKYETFTTETYVNDKSALESADSEISGKVDNKVKVGTYGSALTNKDTLSVMKIADEDYYKLVAEGKTNDDILYIVSSDYVNGHDQRVINVGNAISATDAVNLSGMNAAIDAAKQEIVANSLSGVTLNGVDFTVANNVATLSIDIINCGGAN